MKRPSAARRAYLARRIKSFDRRRHRARMAILRRSRKKTLGAVHADDGIWLVPRTIGLVDDTHRSRLLLGIAKLTRRMCVEGKSAVLDFSRTEKAYCEGMLLLVAEVMNILRLTQGAVSLTMLPPSENKVLQVLKQVGLMDVLNYRSSVVACDEDVVNWRFASGQSVDGQKYEDVLAHFDGSVAAPLQEGLYKGITEAMTNVLNHAYSAPRNGFASQMHQKDWWMFSQERDNVLTVALCDLGAGIPTTLPRTKPVLWKRITSVGRRTDARTIEYALRDSISRTRLGHRGKGLGQIASALDDHDGSEVKVFSNSGIVAIVGGHRSRRDYRDSIRGTLIVWNLPIEPKEPL
jgi:hypothetical protein